MNSSPEGKIALQKIISKDSEPDDRPPSFNTKCSQLAYEFLQSDKLHIFMSIISGISFLTIILASETDTNVWLSTGIYIELVLNSILLIESIARFIVIGFRAMTRRWYWLLDIVFFTADYLPGYLL
eukprot:TRINITY_DN7231_c0_g1_i1.p1 TRINITY_DN7231_c0_g1~~TRINITY_DN7231_c0_g1_i1.p1  ORF type:complete len:126 (-),score=7.86 TRINITY_DN7231_c0_g1_i1:503-880(-)